MFWLRSPDAEADTAMRLTLSSTPRYLGRAALNDLVFDVAAVSARHAAVFVASGRVFVEDLGSRNGTFVDARRVRRRAPVLPGQTIGLGGAVRLLLGYTPDPHDPDPGTRWLLEQLDAPVRWPVAGPVRIGGAAGCDIVVDGPVVTVRPDGAGLVLGDRRLAVGEIVTLGGVAFRVVRAPSDAVSATVDPGPEAPHWVLAVSMAERGGPRAALRSHGAEAAVTWTAPSRAALLYLLARRLDQDRRAGLPVEEQGWCSDAEVAVGVWGRQGIDRSLTVVVTRIRNDLRAASLDPWLLEKRSGHVRLRPDDLTVEVEP